MNLGSVLYFIFIGIFECWVGIALLITALIKRSRGFLIAGFGIQMFLCIGLIMGEGINIANFSGLLFTIFFSWAVLFKIGVNSEENVTENNTEEYVTTIFDTIQNKMRTEKLKVDTVKYPCEEYAENNIYYAVEKMKKGKKERIFYNKEKWTEEIERFKEGTAEMQSLDAFDTTKAERNKVAEKSKKQRKKQYCSICGGKINSETRKCEQCGKQYFKGFKVKDMILVALIVCLGITNIILISVLNDEKDSGEYAWELYYDTLSDLKFYRRNVALVSKDGTKKYHCYGCNSFDQNLAFSVYSRMEAVRRDYSRCSQCHNLYE